MRVLSRCLMTFLVFGCTTSSPTLFSTITPVFVCCYRHLCTLLYRLGEIQERLSPRVRKRNKSFTITRLRSDPSGRFQLIRPNSVRLTDDSTRVLSSLLG